MRAVGLVLVLLSIGLAGGVANRAVGGADADAKIATAESCPVPPEGAEAAQVPPARIALTPPPGPTPQIVPLNTRGYNYADPVAAPTPARGAEPTPPAAPAPR
jgi:hypothetical protein